MKGGKPQSLFQEPLNESRASRVCERILPSDSFVPYELVDSGSQMSRYLSSCPCMADGRSLADRLSVAEKGRAYVTQQAAKAVAEASLSSSTLPHGHGGRRQEVR